MAADHPSGAAADRVLEVGVDEEFSLTLGTGEHTSRKESGPDRASPRTGECHPAV